jgi:2-polyprenyl-3-methyl-5-hydroxy-6-metoxy-1,4-benzoquinol methylase
MMDKHVENVLVKVGTILNNLSPYQFIKSSALSLQGVNLAEKELEHVSVQWDLFDSVYTYFQGFSIKPVTKTISDAKFRINYEGVTIQIECQFNRTIRTNPYRIPIKMGDIEVWVESIYAYLYDSRFNNEIHHYLSSLQDELTLVNRNAWNQEQYDALVMRYGDEQDVARKVKENPEWRLHPFYRHMGNVRGKKIVHLLGSNGIKGVALSVLGAVVTIVDFSKENETYAIELAKSAEVEIQYIQTDVFTIPEQEEHADIVLMELGVLHYFVDLKPLVQVIISLLRKGGQFILHEFHPISTKLITSTGKKHKVTGNYFSPIIEENNVAFSKHLTDNSEEEVDKVLQRKWTIGEVVTAIAMEGMVIKVLEEEPNHKVHDIGLPKTYTLVAEKI